MAEMAIKPFCDAGPRMESPGTVITIGGGITSENMFNALNNLFSGGVEVMEEVREKRLPAGDGPARLVVSRRHYFEEGSLGMPSVGEFVSQLECLATWEIALRTFLTNPFMVSASPLLLWVGTKGVVNENGVEVIVARGGTDAPIIETYILWKDHKFPDYLHFFSGDRLSID